MIAEPLFCQHWLATLGAGHLARVSGSLVDLLHFQRGAVAATKIFRIVILRLTLGAKFHSNGLSPDETQVPIVRFLSP